MSIILTKNKQNELQIELDRINNSVHDNMTETEMEKVIKEANELKKEMKKYIRLKKNRGE